MADLSDLAQLAPAGGARNDLDPVEGPPASAGRFTIYAPRRRGWGSPSIGRVKDTGVLRNLFESGGWLHGDGRVLANGPCSGFHAFLIVPEMASVAVAQVEAIAAIPDEAERAGATLPEGLATATDMRSDPWGDPDDPRWGGPNRVAEKAVRDAGWVRLTMRRDRGVKEILVAPGDHASPFEEHLVALARELGCRIVSTAPEDGPFNVFDPAGEGIEPNSDFSEVAAYPLLGLIPGFKSYDFETGEIEIEGRESRMVRSGSHPAFDERGIGTEEPDDAAGPARGF